jgi:hypothetical protein
VALVALVGCGWWVVGCGLWVVGGGWWVVQYGVETSTTRTKKARPIRRVAWPDGEAAKCSPPPQRCCLPRAKLTLQSSCTQGHWSPADSHHLTCAFRATVDMGAATS